MNEKQWIYYVAYGITGTTAGYGSIQVTKTTPIRTVDDIRIIERTIIMPLLPDGAAPTVLNFQLLSCP